MNPKPLPEFLHHEKTRHGKWVWYVRIGKGARTRLRSEFGSVEFWAEYEAAIGGLAKPNKPSSGTFAWGLALYLKSMDFAKLSLATQRQRLLILRKIEAAIGSSRLKEWRRADVLAGRDKRAATPAAARHFVDALRSMFAYLVEVEHMRENPCDGVKTPQNRRKEGFAVWTAEDEEKFCAQWPLGTRQRLAYAIFRETGLRRGDAASLGRQHIRDGVIRMRTEKTGEEAVIPVSSALSEAITATSVDDLTFLPYTKESLGNWFREACNAAGVTKSAHGLRKASATADALEGWSDAELEAKYAWTGRRMAGHYTRQANRERLAKQAAERTKKAQERPHRSGDEPAPRKKEQ